LPPGSAFTLIEVMLALAISAIVLAAIGGVFFSAVRLRERTAAVLDESVALHHAFSLLRRDLQGALPPGSPFPLAGDFKQEALGGGTSQSSRLQLFTTTGVISDAAPWGDIQEVIYELRDPSQRTSAGGKDLIRSVTRNLLATAVPDPDEQWLMGSVQSLEFSCYDGTDWRDSWDTSLGDTNLPSAVRVRILLASNNNAAIRAQQPFEMVVPLLSQSHTNLPQTTSTGGAP
jgi:prepilin-type N-terminal cleavage/methylation domain-containing protein